MVESQSQRYRVLLSHHSQVVELLKSPLCVGKTRIEVLKILEQKTGRRFHDEHDLHLITVEDENAIPTKGVSLVIVARVKAQLYVRIFDSQGQRVVDESEQDAADDLKSQLQDFWGAEVPAPEKAKIVETITSIYGHSLEYDIWRLAEQAAELGLDVESPPQRSLGNTTIAADTR